MGGSDLSLLDEGTEMMEHHAPQRIALGEVALLVWPAAVRELQMDAAIGSLAELERGGGTDRITGAADALPDDLAGVVRRDFPHEGRAAGNIAAATRHLGGRPSLEALKGRQGIAHLCRVRFDVDGVKKGMSGQMRLLDGEP